MTEHPSLDRASYLTEIVDASDDAVITKDLDSVIHACNAAATRVFNSPAVERPELPKGFGSKSQTS